MHREPRRIDANLDELANAKVLFQNGVRNLKLVTMQRVHFNTVDQLIIVGQTL